MSNKVTLRSYGYYLHFLHLIFEKKGFLQLCPKLPNFAQKPQRILGITTQILATHQKYASKYYIIEVQISKRFMKY
jgi:hypothetical protein